MRITKIVCLLLAIVSFPLALMMAGFAPMLGAGGTKTLAQAIGVNTLMAIVMAVPLWILFFGWRTLRSWSSDSNTSAILMAFPALLVIAMFAYANLVAR